MKRIIVLLVILFIQLPLSAYSRDPANKSECISMLRPELEKQCGTLFGDDDKAEVREACLENIDKEIKKQCDRFFGSDSDFCSTCTSACINQYKETDSKRIECLDMCFKNPACKSYIEKTFKATKPK
jgi:hypothetical protein